MVRWKSLDLRSPHQPGLPNLLIEAMRPMKQL